MRTTLGTNLTRASVAPQLAHKIMRHSDYRTTQKHYTVLGLTDATRALQSLPDIKDSNSNKAKATGTTDTQAIHSAQQYTQQRERESMHMGAKPCNRPGSSLTHFNDRKSSDNTASCEPMQPDATTCNTPRGCNSMVECQPYRRPSAGRRQRCLSRLHESGPVAPQRWLNNGPAE